ncbi:hypothetical protein MBANPS3_001123 [Mucor bainieri]
MDPQQLASDQKPSDAYLQQSSKESVLVSQQPKQLLILDLNGTLISRVKCRARVGRAFYARPHYQAFLDFIFKHFEVMVWSSARQENVEKMCHVFTQPLKLVWSRSHLNLSQQQFRSNVDTVKDLEIVWKHFLGETFHHEEIREEYPDNELLKVMKYLDIVRAHSNVANYVRCEPFLSHRHIVPENRLLDLAMQYFSRAGKFALPYQPPKKRAKRRRVDDDDMLDVKLEPVDELDDKISVKLESGTTTKKERPLRRIRRPRPKKQKQNKKRQNKKKKKNVKTELQAVKNEF